MAAEGGGTPSEAVTAEPATGLPAGTTSRRSRVAAALLTLSRVQTGALNPYLRRHLSGHVAYAEAWTQLAAATEVLDALDISALTSDVLNSTVSWTDLPGGIAGSITNRLLVEAHPESRASLRLLGAARLTGYACGHQALGGLSRVRVTWARRFVRGSASVPLAGHTGTVWAVAAVSLPDGRTLLATGSGDATVRLWDPTTGTPVGEPLTGHTGPVLAVAAVPLPDGRTLLATASSDRTVRLWDPTTGTPVGEPLTGHTNWVRAVAAVPLPDGRTLLATGGGGYDKTVRLWDPTTGTPIGEPITGHAGWVRAVAAVPLPDGRTLLATGGDDDTVRLWDPTTGTPAGKPLTGHTDWVRAVAAVPLPDGRTLLATGSDDDTVRLWDPTTGTPAGEPLTGHTRPVYAVAAVPLPDGRTLLATGSSDRTVRLWDPATGEVIDQLVIDDNVTGIAHNRNLLFVSTGHGLLAVRVPGHDAGSGR
jgi:WD domain, G-beta repeat